MVPLDADTLPRLLPQCSANPEASATLEKVNARVRDLFVSGQLEKFAVTITEYGFGPLLTVPVIVMWASHLPECFNDLSTPIILRRYNISLGSKGWASAPTSSNIPPAPPLPPPTPPLAAPRSLRRVKLPEPGGTTVRDRALSDLYRGATNSAEKSKRLHFFTNLPAPVGGTPGVPLLGHGSSISSTQGEERGSLGVFLAPCSSPMDCYFLSTRHVFSKPPGSPVQTPSHLDTLRKLANIVCGSYTTARQETECDLVQQQVESNVATFMWGSIGVDRSDEGWRKDWALCHVGNHVKPGFAGVNGGFTEEHFCNMLHALELDYDFGIEYGMGVAKAKAGSTVFKVGATTSTTRGIVNKEPVYYYQTGTADPKDPKDSIPYDCTKLCLILRHFSSDPPFCARGDTGAGVFACSKEGRLSWVGLLVGIEGMEDPETSSLVRPSEFGFMIPQDIVLSQIEEETGIKWGLYDAPVEVW